jgi:hypothetical protein
VLVCEDTSTYGLSSRISDVPERTWYWSMCWVMPEDVGSTAWKSKMSVYLLMYLSRWWYWSMCQVVVVRMWSSLYYKRQNLIRLRGWIPYTLFRSEIPTKSRPNYFRRDAHRALRWSNYIAGSKRECLLRRKTPDMRYYYTGLKKLKFLPSF